MDILTRTAGIAIERRRSEEAVRFQARLLDTVGQAAIVTKPDGEIVYWNHFAETLYGWSKDEALRRNIADLLISPGAKQQAGEIMEQLRAGKNWSGEFEVQRRDGTQFDALVTDAPLLDERGNVTAIIGVSVDITQRKQLEKSLRFLADASATLAGLVDFEKTLHKVAALAVPHFADWCAVDMEESDGTLRRLAVAHVDPAKVQLATELDQRQDDDAIEVRSMMERQLNQMVRLVDDLLDVSRITRNKLELRKQRFEFKVVVQSAIETSRPLMEQLGHTFSSTLPSTAVYLDADMTRLAQVFSNLLNNSAKYTPGGGSISLMAETSGDEISVKIRDDGMGIPAESLRSIFEVFSQVDRNLERAQGGLGIGLTLVRRLVEMHGGSVEASSAGPGQGSEFTVRLPVLTDGIEEQTAAPSNLTGDSKQRVDAVGFFASPNRKNVGVPRFSPQRSFSKKREFFGGFRICFQLFSVSGDVVVSDSKNRHLSGWQHK